MTYRLRNVAIAIGLALVAMLLTLFYVINYRRSVQHQQATVQVFVAAHNIAAGTTGADLAHNHAFKSVSVTRGMWSRARSRTRARWPGSSSASRSTRVSR